jgi:hypothetical protein
MQKNISAAMLLQWLIVVWQSLLLQKGAAMCAGSQEKPQGN